MHLQVEPISSRSLNTCSLFYMIPLGLSGTTSIRVSNELGSGRPQAAHLAVHVALSMVATKGILVATVMILGRNVWGNCHSKDEEVVIYVGKMLNLVAVSHLIDGIQSVLSGFASLEAKRKFRAPRMSPNHPSPEDNSSLSPKEYITVDAAECKTNCLPASLLESENMGTVPHANNPVEHDLATEVTDFSDMVAETRSPEHTLLQQPQYSIQKPCTALTVDRAMSVVENTESHTVDSTGTTGMRLVKMECEIHFDHGIFTAPY